MSRTCKWCGRLLPPKQIPREFCNRGCRRSYETANGIQSLIPDSRFRDWIMAASAALKEEERAPLKVRQNLLQALTEMLEDPRGSQQLLKKIGLVVRTTSLD